MSFSQRRLCESCIARAATLRDGMTLLRIRNNPRARKSSSSPELISYFKHLTWMLRRQNRKATFLVSDSSGLLGYVRFRSIGKDCFVWSFAKDPHREGVGFQLATCGLAHFRKLFHPVKILAVVQVTNTRSLEIHNSLGFRRQEAREQGIDLRTGEVLMSLSLDFT